MRITSVAVVAALLIGAPAFAQHGNVPDQDPTRAKNAATRQRAGKTKVGEKMRNTRCKIIVQKGQDKRVCGVPSNVSPGDGRKR